MNITSDNQRQTDTNNPKKRKTCSQIDLPYVLTNDEFERADERAKNIRVPHDFGLKPSPFISKHRGALKQIATHGILKYCLRGCLSEDCRSTLLVLLDSISQICSEFVSIDDLDEMECELNRALALLKRDFPLSRQNITTHVLHHIVNGIRHYGPVYGTWMYNLKDLIHGYVKEFLINVTQKQQ
ncbi:hypothetical protein CI610_03786 [invertebrate metagenome]|uniref:Uncharacterized protein n=1 Tax=invertebrate metagenome TaxID=1711999 RepID=A0A2H9T237_9ZZZZ